MLACLLLDGIICGNHQQNGVHSRSACEHIPNKTFVARNVDHSKTMRRNFQMSEAKLNRDATFLFFGKSVGINPRQCPNQRSLSVVNVACGAQNEVVRFHAVILTSLSSSVTGSRIKKAGANELNRSLLPLCLRCV